MKHPPSPHDPLLDELLAGPELELLRETALRQMLAESRRARHHRQALRSAVLALVPLLAALAIVGHFFPRASRRPIAPLANTSPLPPGSSGLRIVTDAELFAFFPNRPVALIGPPGHQKLVFLDEKHTEDAAHPSPGAGQQPEGFAN